MVRIIIFLRLNLFFMVYILLFFKYFSVKKEFINIVFIVYLISWGKYC